MFDNISQGLFLTGGTGYLIVVPILRFKATIFMVVSTYKILKIRNDKHKIYWLFSLLFPLSLQESYMKFTEDGLQKK